MKYFSSTATCPACLGTGSPRMHPAPPIGAHTENIFIGELAL